MAAASSAMVAMRCHHGVIANHVPAAKSGHLWPAAKRHHQKNHRYAGGNGNDNDTSGMAAKKAWLMLILPAASSA